MGTLSLTGFLADVLFGVGAAAGWTLFSGILSLFGRGPVVVKSP